MISAQGIANFIGRFRTPGVLVGMIAVCVAPLPAQSFSSAHLAISRMAVPFSVGSAPAMAQGVLKPEDTDSATFFAMAQNSSGVWECSRDYSHPKPGLEDMVEFSGTPFTQEVRMPLGSLLRGRISLSGFNTVTPMESLQQGLPGSGSLDVWSSATTGHTGTRIPKDDNRYGLSLTFHHAGNAGEALSGKVTGFVGRLIGKPSR